MKFWLVMLLFAVGSVALSARQGDNIIFLCGYLLGVVAGYLAFTDAAKVRQGGAE